MRSGPITKRREQRGERARVARASYGLCGDVLQNRVVPEFVCRGFLRDRERPAAVLVVTGLLVSVPQLECGAEMVGSRTGAIDDPTCQTAQQKVDGPTYLSQTADRSTSGRRYIRQQI
jgi:hypothetical protein